MCEMKFFLGANTKDGFCSCFDELRNLRGYRHQYIIKGCPGSGKSTFMRRIAQASMQKGYRTECILCSSDADSLDGVIVHDLGISFADGTSPHVVEPRYAGVKESYIDFSPYWNTNMLEERGEEIKTLDAKIKSCYKMAYGHLHCAGIYEELLFDTVQLTRSKELHRRISGLLKRELPKIRKGVAEGKKFVRYLSGYTPFGYQTCTETVHAMCDRVIGMTDSYGIASNVLALCADTAMQAGFDVYMCLDPLYGKTRIAHLLIPQLRLGFVGIKRSEKEFVVDKRINLDNYIEEPSEQNIQRHIKRLRNLSRDAVAAGTEQIAKAKDYHDLLEQTYRPCMDFAGIDMLAQKWLAKLTLQ